MFVFDSDIECSFILSPIMSRCIFLSLEINTRHVNIRSRTKVTFSPRRLCLYSRNEPRKLFLTALSAREYSWQGRKRHSHRTFSCIKYRCIKLLFSYGTLDIEFRRTKKEKTLPKNVCNSARVDRETRASPSSAMLRRANNTRSRARISEDARVFIISRPRRSFSLSLFFFSSSSH